MRYFIGLGANVGDRLTNLREAVRHLEALGTVTARSRVYASAAVGGPPQASYLNAAVVLECALEPLELLAKTQEIEVAVGRDRSSEVRWGPRTLDVDLLLCGARGERIVDEPTLCVPHPRLKDRGFALAPLLDVEPTLMHPELSRPLRALLSAALASGQAWAPTGDAL
ncbi:MAG: 2-amino-4-hydroxy-6-hydroxymethyldihydropteridine pyrophosphokinae [Myxococcales bacterium]|nr:2-amino-4-hydroxy-6-hydroxymethyldihydropteridine pyrophosphokinae [Myxococcales bacterium]